MADDFTADWAVAAGDKPTAAKWNEIGDSLDFLMANLVPIGVEMMWVGSSAPASPAGVWLLENGQSLLRADYPDLYNLITTTYGFVDATHFNLPDKRGRLPVGYVAGDADFGTMGKAGGGKTHSHSGTTSGVTANHSHAYTGVYETGHSAAGSYWNHYEPIAANTGQISADHGHNISLGSGTADSTIQPYQVTNFIIKAL